MKNIRETAVAYGVMLRKLMETGELWQVHACAVQLHRCGMLALNQSDSFRRKIAQKANATAQSPTGV